MRVERSVSSRAEAIVDRLPDATLALDAWLVVAGERLLATIIELSRTRVRLYSPEPLITGETVELELGCAGYVLVRICSTRGGEAEGVLLGQE